jgi:hypothetical protein
MARLIGFMMKKDAAEKGAKLNLMVDDEIGEYFVVYMFNFGG